jgi:hypothetical protein
MELWLETLGVVLIAGVGIRLGIILSGLKKPYWIASFAIPLLIIAVLAAARFSQTLYFFEPVFWLTSSRFRFVALSFAISTGIAIPLPRLPHKWERYTAGGMMVILVIWSSILPFLFPALIKDRLSAIKTRFDKNGICRQSTEYTCGPAAAVTALEKLGLSASEGEIAILSYASPVSGTLPAQLCSALQNRFGTEGLKCQFRRFDSIAQLNNAGVTLVVVKESALIDHCVVVLDVGDNIVTVADPVTGKELIPYEQFEKIWRFSGIVMERDFSRRI